MACGCKGSPAEAGPLVRDRQKAAAAETQGAGPSGM